MGLETVFQLMPASFDKLQIVMAASSILVEMEVGKKPGPEEVKFPLLLVKPPALKPLSD